MTQTCLQIFKFSYTGEWPMVLLAGETKTNKKFFNTDPPFEICFRTFWGIKNYKRISFITKIFTAEVGRYTLKSLV